ETVTCTFNDKLLEGAISIHKTDTKGNDVAGAKFTATASDGTTVYNFPDTDASGNACVENLPFDTYTVAETAAPPGYTKDTSTQQVTVNSAGTCASGATPAANDFVDVPLSDIQVNFRDGGSGKTSATSITCDNTTGTGSDTPATGWDASHTVTGVEVDPSPLTIHCTITIDP
ncbi:MAG TPA: prealbumin-like fold domain-containing protein, partial [Gaiellaceae bacterium]|nr:prealbumin-like fold domain-containing protein [Gaiellaceae bacterium]